MTAADDPGFAPAKINLTLHLTGRRPDGYHLLGSLVAFAGVGDNVRCAPATGDPATAITLTVTGPHASGLNTDDNLVLRAARALARRHGVTSGAALSLEKHLPVASGIGGGSSDAAAALRLLACKWQVGVPPDLAISLGADVPACMAAPAPQLMSGIGEILAPSPPLPDCWTVLVNPGTGVETASVFAKVGGNVGSKLAATASASDQATGTAFPGGPFATFADFCGWLHQQRNDLQSAAQEICPPVSEILQALSPAPFARMSGSGATCFALLPDRSTAQDLAQRLARRADWWVAAAPILRPRDPN